MSTTEWLQAPRTALKAAVPAGRAANALAQRRKIIALIPAHNEETTIANTVRAVLSQELPVDSATVLCDNCSDGTERAAQEAGAEVYVTVDNHDMKAGALNQALALKLPGLGDRDMVMCIDADSIAGGNFTTEAAIAFDSDPRIGGVSGVYQGRRGGGVVGWCQRNEFARWGFDSRMYKGRTVILSGAASIFTVGALRKVAAGRTAGTLPGSSGIYCEQNITEDFELSLALLHVGVRIKNLLNVHIETAVKQTWRTLGVQRLRWDRGINEGIFQYGITRHTRKVWFQRTMYAVFVPVSFLVFMVIGARAATGTVFQINLLWAIISGVMMFQKGATIYKTRGLWNAILAGLVFPELAYDTYLQLTFTRALVDQVTNKTAKWR
jgi:cellulose synthase/poly-beta-1,6-N-acetylglucosamine synthase-like glycosyltransferase